METEKTTLKIVEELLEKSWNRGHILIVYDKKNSNKKSYYVEVENPKSIKSKERFYLKPEELKDAEKLVKKYSKVHEDAKKKMRELRAKKAKVKRDAQVAVDNEELTNEEQIMDPELEKEIIEEAIIERNRRNPEAFNSELDELDEENKEIEKIKEK